MKKIYIIIMCMLITIEFSIYAPMEVTHDTTAKTSSAMNPEGDTALQTSVIADAMAKNTPPPKPPKPKINTNTVSAVADNGFDFFDPSPLVEGAQNSAQAADFTATLAADNTLPPAPTSPAPSEHPTLTPDQIDAVNNINATTPQTQGKITETRTTLTNHLSNAFSKISGNKQETSTDISTGDTTLTTKDKNGTVIATKTTNKQGQVTETMTVNPVSGAKTTTKYNDPTGKDKSSTTTIEDPNNPQSPITELRDADGKLTSIKDKDSNEISTKDQNGNIIPTKTTVTALQKLTTASKPTSSELVDVNKVPSEIFKEDVTTAVYQAGLKLSNALRASGKVTDNTQNLSVKAFNAPQDDVNAAYRTIRDQDQNSRTVITDKFNELTGSGLVAGAKRLVTSVDKLSFTKDLIQKSIDSRLGSDKSGNSLFVLTDSQNEAMAKLFTSPRTDGGTDYTPLFDKNSKLSDVDKINLIAKMQDEAMNNMASGIATFKTVFDAKGNCTSTTTQTTSDGSTITLTSSFDTNNNPIKNSIDIDGTTYTATTGNGWLYGKSITKEVNGKPEGTPLESQDGAFLSQGWLMNKSMQAFKLSAKLALSAPKQIVINVVAIAIPTTMQVVAAAIYVPVVKIVSMVPVVHTTDASGNKIQQTDSNGNPVFAKDKYGNTLKDTNNKSIPVYEVNKSVTGYQLTGHSFGDPTLRVATLKLADISIGDDGSALLSQAVGIKTPLLASGKGSPVFNPDTSIAKSLAKLQGKTPEQAAQDAANLNASYFTLIDPIIETAKLPLKLLFPKSRGGQVVLTDNTTDTNSSSSSKSTTSNSRGSSTINTFVQDNNRANALDALNGNNSYGGDTYGTASGDTLVSLLNLIASLAPVK